MHIFIPTFLNILENIFLAGERTKRVERGGIVYSSNDQVIGDEGGAALIDDLAPYLPDVNSIESSQILETCVRDFELGPKHPIEVESFDNVVDDVSTERFS